jgi:hypothetical protein
MYGNLQMFPRPTAEPAAAATTPSLLPNESRFEKSKPLISITLFITVFFF